ncbi:MAG: HD domain-containing protein [Gammaproteobacteria bacterium]|nr:HD domain-containing protein [Gammaproteobacteria bacterium]
MKTVNFIHMANGTKQDYEFLAEQEEAYVERLPDRILAALEKLNDSFAGYQVSRLEHSLQSATRAYQDGRSTDYVVAALLHDIGDELAPYSHSEMAAAILRPYVSERIYWIIKTHGVFQMFYYAHHVGEDQHARNRFADHRWFDDAVEFCELYDQNCFDPSYKSKSLEFFTPMIRQVFSRKPAFAGG